MVGIAKLDQCTSITEAIETLSTQEKRALLGNREAFDRLKALKPFRQNAEIRNPVWISTRRGRRPVQGHGQIVPRTSAATRWTSFSTSKVERFPDAVAWAANWLGIDIGRRAPKPDRTREAKLERERERGRAQRAAGEAEDGRGGWQGRGGRGRGGSR